MTKAYMSDRTYRERWARVNRTHGVTALREARAILAETEPNNPSANQYGETVSLSVLNDGLKALRGVPGKRFTIRTEEGQILAESLAAFVAADLTSAAEEDDDTDVCSRCGADLDLEGYDGLCGNCADRAELSE